MIYAAHANEPMDDPKTESAENKGDDRHAGTLDFCVQIYMRWMTSC